MALLPAGTPALCRMASARQNTSSAARALRRHAGLHRQRRLDPLQVLGGDRRQRHGPVADAAVAAGGRQLLTVGVEGDGRGRARRRVQRAQLLQRRHVPDLRRPPPGHAQQVALAARPQGGDGAYRRLNAFRRDVAGQRPQADAAVGVSRGDATAHHQQARAPARRPSPPAQSNRLRHPTTAPACPRPRPGSSHRSQTPAAPASRRQACTPSSPAGDPPAPAPRP